MQKYCTKIPQLALVMKKKSVMRKNILKAHFFSIEGIKGEKLACFVLYLKIINIKFE